MSTKPPTALAEAAAGRTLAAESRVRQALRSLDRDGHPISFAAVAQHARVSRAFLYNHPDFRAEIEELRGRHAASPSRLPVAERSSEASVRTRLRAALDDNQRLRSEIAELREELSLAHGRARELELECRVRGR
jgi:hypothetical protein